MKKNILRGLGLALATAASLATVSVSAQEKPADFPQRPISLVVVYPAGGAVDVTARTFAKLAEEQMGIDIRVENRVGGAGMVGHTSLAKNTDPDGYTVGVLANPFLYTDILLKNAPFELDEFTPINEISFDPMVWVVNAKSDVGKMSFDEIIAHAKETPLQVGMNPNSVFLFVSEFIERSKDVEFNFIPFDGGKQGVVALLAGDVDATASFYSEIGQYVDSGDLKPVAVTGDKRHPMLPDTPTLSELGVPAGGQAWGATRIFTLPAGVPDDRKAYLADGFLKVLESDEAQKAFAEAGLTLTPAGPEAAQEQYQQSFETLKTFLAETGRIQE